MTEKHTPIAARLWFVSSIPKNMTPINIARFCSAFKAENLIVLAFAESSSLKEHHGLDKVGRLCSLWLGSRENTACEKYLNAIAKYLCFILTQGFR